MVRRLVSTILLMIVSVGGYSLGLGNIELSSALNQSFDARIELLSPTSSEVGSLTIRIADIEAFNRAGIEWSLVLSSLRFEIVINDTGADYIHITSSEPIREPYLNFLVEASWSSGRLYREYTVLLDPPLYDPGVRRLTVPAAPVAESPSQSIIRSPSTDSPGSTSSQPPTSSTPGSQFAPEPVASPRISSFSGDEYGPVVSNDTLWSIANRVRPDTSISIQQMMLAILRTNPQAFINNNINGLREGHILRIPDRDEILNTSIQAAMAETRSQNAIWEEVRGTFAASATQRPIDATSQSTSTVTSSDVVAGSELRLVSPDTQSTGSGQTGASFDSAGQLSTELTLANEQMETLTSENSELRDQVEESEIIIQDLSRLVELKDNELAGLQQQMVTSEVQGESVVPDGEGIIDNDQSEEQVDLTAEGITTLDLDEITEDMVTVEPVETVDEPVNTLPPATTTDAQNITPESGIMDQILNFVFANIKLLGGALAAMVLGIIGFFYYSGKRDLSEDVDMTEYDDVDADLDFPAFETTSEDLELTSEDLNLPPEDFQIPSFETTDEFLADRKEDDEVDYDDADETSFIEDEDSIEQENDVVQADTSEETAATDSQESDEDPLAEVNVFLAYEHFDQAEEFVRDAIERDPNNLEFHGKLLEVFYSSGDKVKYEEQARTLHELVGGEGPHWDMAQIMWQEISPKRELFAEPVEGEEIAEIGESSGSGIVDLTAEENTEVDNGALDFDLGDSGIDNTVDDDVLDITTGVKDLLGLTSDNLEDSNPDILDVTSAVGFSTGEEAVNDDDTFLDFTPDDNGEEDVLDITTLSASDDDLQDLAAIGDSADGAEESSSDDNIIEFDTGTEDDEAINLDFASEDEQDSDGEGSLDLSMDADVVDSGIGFEETQELDVVSPAAPEIEYEDTHELDVVTPDAAPEIEFEETQELDAVESVDPDIQMENTVQLERVTMPDKDNNGQEPTVFIPRTADGEEQSAEDEVATKLDLAKAYVELGDNDNAIKTLDEIITEGNDVQRQQAEELKGQIH